MMPIISIVVDVVVVLALIYYFAMYKMESKTVKVLEKKEQDLKSELHRLKMNEIRDLQTPLSKESIIMVLNVTAFFDPYRSLMYSPLRGDVTFDIVLDSSDIDEQWYTPAGDFVLDARGIRFVLEVVSQRETFSVNTGEVKKIITVKTSCTQEELSAIRWLERNKKRKK